MGIFKKILKKLETSHEEAKTAHSSFYQDEFEISQMERRNFWDFFPMNLIFWYVEMPFVSNWDGLISSNGEKVVITRPKRTSYTGDLKKVGRTYEISSATVNSIKIKKNKIRIKFNKRIKGITGTLVNRRVVKIKLKPDYNNIEQLCSVIKKL